MVGSGPREMIGKKLDGNGSIELGIDRPIDDAHSPGAERRLYDVHAEPKASQHRQCWIAQDPRGGVEGGPVQKVPGAIGPIEECLDLRSESIITVAFPLEERLTRACRAFQC